MGFPLPRSAADAVLSNGSTMSDGYLRPERKSARVTGVSFRVTWALASPAGGHKHINIKFLFLSFQNFPGNHVLCTLTNSYWCNRFNWM